MKRRKWDPETKAMIVVEGLKGKQVIDICIEHQISQAQYYQWRDQFLSHISQLFIRDDRKEKALTRENERLKRIIGELTVELKKNRRVATMRRKESELIAERNSPVVERIKALKAEHPFRGYRRIWANLRYIDELEINKKRVLRLLQKHDLLVKPHTKLKAVRTPPRSKPKPHRANQWWASI
jgi:transposase-like protein